MAAHQLTHLSNPLTLQNMAPSTLAEFLRPHSAHLVAFGVSAEGLARPAPETFVRLAELFTHSADSLPPGLVTALVAIDRMATAEGRDCLVTAIPSVGASATPADTAVRAWLDDRSAFERASAERLVGRRFRRFVSYQSLLAPSLEQATRADLLAALQVELDRAFQQHGRGQGTRVLSIRRDEEVWFLVRHGEALQSEDCLRDGESQAIVFRPERYDIVAINPARREMRISASSRWQKMLYRRFFGQWLLGYPDAYPSDDRYTLDPLLTDGAMSLAVSDIPAIEHLKLVRLEYFETGRCGLGGAKWGEDLFAAIHLGMWDMPRGARLTCAKFEMRLRGSRRSRLVTITPPNEVKYSLESDGALVEAWLEKRGFLVSSAAGENDVAADFAAILACA